MKKDTVVCSGSSCLPFPRRTHLRKHLALPSTGQCLPEQPWREHPGTLLCFRFSMKHGSTCCLSNNEFLVSGVRNTENCEAESSVKGGELWITLQRETEGFWPKVNFYLVVGLSFLPSRKLWWNYSPGFSQIMLWTIYSFQETWRK